MKKLLTLIFVLSAMVYGAVVPSTFYETSRALGMGGAYTAVSDDFSMLMYNPANLSKNQPLHICLLKAEIEINQKTLDFASWLMNNSSKLSGDFTTWSASDIQQLINAGIFLNVGDNFSVTGINTPIGNFGVGAFAKATANVSVTEEILDIKAHLSAKIDVTVPISYGTQLDMLNDVGNMLGGGKFGFGATVKLMQRFTTTEDKSILSMASFDPAAMINRLANPQTGYGVDVALNYNLPSWSSTFCLVARDVYSVLGTDSIASNWVFGYALQPNLIPGVPLTISVDVNDLFGSTTMMKKISLGAEVNLIGLAVVRGGFYQGWASFGVSLFGFLDYANYGVEQGLYAGNFEQRYHRISITLGL
ncbi:MAG: hypothetical protein A2231_02230 [Candidatus Firestonebacteria bacterium RIFOXYA2_FULL_40_8]|nr:MAG: hypothetical protein A2231_02230 [Candidatus Firestonebacteria bacterium RIFOXYA2_FULL_40_8]